MRVPFRIQGRPVFGFLLLAMLLATSAMSWRVLSADEESADAQKTEQIDQDATGEDADSASQPESDEDLAQRVEVTVPPTLRSSGRRNSHQEHFREDARRPDSPGGRRDERPRPLGASR